MIFGHFELHRGIRVVSYPFTNLVKLCARGYFSARSSFIAPMLSVRCISCFGIWFLITILQNSSISTHRRILISFPFAVLDLLFRDRYPFRYIQSLKIWVIGHPTMPRNAKRRVFLMLLGPALQKPLGAFIIHPPHIVLIRLKR